MSSSGFLLDTNVVSELSKRTPDLEVTNWFQDVAEHRLYLSVLVIGEIRQGIERLHRRAPKRAAALDSWASDLASWFPKRILPITDAIADQWGRLNTARSLPAVDGLLAATALVHDLVLVTRNTGDLSGLGANVVNPWLTAEP